MKRVFLLLTLAFVALSCEQVDDFVDDRGHGLVYIEGEQKAIFPDKGDTKNYKFTAEMDWRAEVSADWVEVKPSSGKAGENKIQIKVEKNKTDKKRTGYVDIFLSNDDTYRIELEQLAADGGDGDGENDDIYYDSSEIPTNEIWYLSTDGQVVEPEKSGVEFFGAEIISNTYTDGKGVILFDGEVSKIGESAFYSYFSPRETLIGVFMPSSIKEVGFGAFYMCENLQYVELSDGLTTIGDQAFSETNIENITIPESVVTVGSNPFDTCLNLKEFKGKYAADSGRCLIVDGVLKSFAIGCGLTSYTTPAEAKTIGLYSFTGCQLTDIIVAPGTEKLEFRTFAFSESLSSITIPDSVINFSHAILSGCLNLKEINCFYSSEDKRCLTVNGVCIAFAGAGITEYTIPEYVGCLGQELFAGCRGLTYVVLPSTIAEIGFAAFYNCTNLKEVYSMSKVPPVMRVDGSGGYEFDGNAPDRVIYVPKESVVAYKEADRWYDYADSIVGYDNQLAAPELTIEDITDSSFTVAWQQVENADYYLVDDGSKKHEVYDNHFTVENISSGKYTIKVKSMAALGSPYVSSSFAQVEHVFGSLSDDQRQCL